MALPDWAQWASLGLGGGGVGGMVTLLLRARSESRKTTADTTQVVVGASDVVFNQLTRTVERLDAKVEALEAKDRARDEHEEQHEMVLRRHSRWDRTMAEELREHGVVVPDPPPLWPATG